MAKRWTAYKMNIKDIVGGNYTEDGFVKFGNLQANRVRVMGTVVSKLIGDSRKYGFFILDDGTETIRVRAFEDQLSLIEKVEIGDIVDIVHVNSYAEFLDQGMLSRFARIFWHSST